MQVFEDFPKEIIFLDEIEINGCVLENSKTNIDVVTKQIWEGSRSPIDFIKKIIGLFDNSIANNQCDGVKDILMDWEKQEIKTFIFYTPRATAKAIRKKLFRKINTNIILEKIESYIAIQCKRNTPNMAIYNLDNENSEVETIFNISILKKEFDRDSRGSEKIYFIGLKYNLNTSKDNIYLNNTPIREESGLILGKSKILRHKLKKGYISIQVDDGIEIEFFGTSKFSSKDEDIGDDLNDIEFSDKGDIAIELDNYNNPLVLESSKEKNLIFSIDENSEYGENIDEPISTNNELIDKDIKVNMDSFFIPNNKGLKSVNLLLLKKRGQNIIAGGQYYSGLIDCNILANISINLNQESITITNYSNGELSFSNYEDNVLRLDKHNYSVGDNSGLYTEIPTASSNTNNGFTEIGKLNIESNEIIKKSEKHTFNVKEIEFNDSNISFDKSGVLIRYSSFCLTKFKKEFAFHRTAYKMSDSGTIIDCFLNQLSRGVFEYGARIYDNHSTILGTLLSSTPIYLKQLQEGLEIDSTALMKRGGYTIQILASSKTYILKDRYNAKKIIKKSEMKNFKIEIIPQNWKKPLIAFSLEFD